MAMTATEKQRYARHLSLAEIGAAGQSRLKNSKVVVIGAGGLGSPSALYLAAAGVGKLALVDYDVVDLSNLQRQVLFTNADVAQSKVAAAAKRLAALNPDIEVVAHDLQLTADNILDTLREYDVVIDGTDRVSTRYLINDACVILGKPLVSAAIHRFEGQALTYLPERGPCYRCLFPNAKDGQVPNCADAGVLGVLPGVMGSIQATEAIKLILGIGELLTGRLLTYDALTTRFDEFTVARRTDCAVCGEHPTILTPQDAVPKSKTTAAQRALISHSTPRQLQLRLESAAESTTPILLVDVREPHEFERGHLAGCVNVPIGELAARMDELVASLSGSSRGRSSRPDVVFVCRSGGRSLQACEMAVGARLTAVPINLDGGLLAWARDVDPEFVVAPV